MENIDVEMKVVTETEQYMNTSPEEKIENEDGTPEEQDTFLRELERFYEERHETFKVPTLCGSPINCLKLRRSVAKLGGYDQVTNDCLWMKSTIIDSYKKRNYKDDYVLYHIKIVVCAEQHNAASKGEEM